ncbi:MAG: hypothetical protein WDN69_37925 [Aliidongia sp.]
MALLEDALDAHGGIDRWRHLQRFTLHISIGGPLIARKGKAGTLNEVVAEGSTETQSVRISGIGRNRIGAMSIDRIASPSRRRMGPSWRSGPIRVRYFSATATTKPGTISISPISPAW